MLYVAVNFELAGSNSFRDIKNNHFVTAETAADIDDSIKRKRLRPSLVFICPIWTGRDPKVLRPLRRLHVLNVVIGYLDP